MEAIIDIGILEDIIPPKNKITYTEDHVPVRCLYVGSVKPHVTKGQIEGYFYKQGTLEHTKFIDKGEYKYALVTFATYEETTRILNKKNHIVAGCKLKVRPADTWHQPPFKKEDLKQIEDSPEKPVSVSDVSTNGNSEPEDIDESLPSLMMLNDDCLLHILSFMNVLDMIHLRGVCERLNEIIDRKCKKKFETFDFEKLSQSIGEFDLTLMNARDIFQYLGPTMKSLTIDASSFHVQTNANRLLDIIIRHCQSLEVLSLDGFTFNRANVKKISPIIKNLRELFIGESTKCSDEIGLFLTDTDKLEKLTISGNYEITGKCLVKTKNLQVLSLNCCGNLQPKLFVQALQNNRTLKKLEIERCDKLDDHVVNCIITDLQNIEELSISNSYPCMSSYARFTELSNLKKLSIEFHSFASIDKILQNLAEKNSLEQLKLIGSGSGSAVDTTDFISKITTLKALSISFNSNVSDKELEKLKSLQELEILSVPGSNNVTTDGIMKLIKSCKKIKYLDVSQTKVNETLLNQLVELWTAEPYTRPFLEVVVYMTEIDEASETVIALMQQNNQRIKVSFLPKILNTFQFMFGDSDFDSDDDDDDDLFDDLDEDDDDDFDFPFDYYDDQFDSDDPDRYMYGWGRVDLDSPDFLM